MKKTIVLFTVCLLGLTSTNFSHLNAQITLIENNFDGVADDTGPAFQLITNGSGGNGSADLSTGVVTNFSFGTNTSGLNSSAGVDVLTAAPDVNGFTIEFVVESVTDAAAIEANGFFFGVVSGTDAFATDGPGLFNNNPAAVGVRLFNGEATNANPSYSFVEDPDGGAATTVNTSLGTPTAGFVAEIEDGFTISITVNSDDTVSAFSTGLGADDFTFSGTIGTQTSYAAIAGDLGAYVSGQGSAVVYDIGSITLTALQPDAGPACLLADVDMNGFVNILDISPFIAILSSGGFQCEADLDENGIVNILDITPFIQALAGG